VFRKKKEVNSFVGKLVGNLVILVTL